jgi:hypothetical protein
VRHGGAYRQMPSSGREEASTERNLPAPSTQASERWSLVLKAVQREDTWWQREGRGESGGKERVGRGD